MKKLISPILHYSISCAFNDDRFEISCCVDDIPWELFQRWEADKIMIKCYQDNLNCMPVLLLKIKGTAYVFCKELNYFELQHMTPDLVTLLKYPTSECLVNLVRAEDGHKEAVFKFEANQIDLHQLKMSVIDQKTRYKTEKNLLNMINLIDRHNEHTQEYMLKNAQMRLV